MQRSHLENKTQLIHLVSAHLANVPDIPDVETVVIVDNGNPGVLLVIGHGAGVGVLGVVGVGGHVGDGEALGHVHAQVVGPRQGRDELEAGWGEASHDSVRTPDEDKLLAHRETIGTVKHKRDLSVSYILTGINDTTRGHLRLMAR